MSKQMHLSKLKPKYHFDLEQGSEDWLQIRLGKLTGTGAVCLVTKGRSKDNLGAGAITEIYRNVDQLVQGEDESYFAGNAATEHGKDNEALAREAYELEEMSSVRECGFVQLGEYLGFSPDGLVSDDGLVEIKCLSGKEHVRLYVDEFGAVRTEEQRRAMVDKKYIAQMQFGLWLTRREWCDNVYFHPNYRDLSFFKVRFHKDPEYMQLFDEKVPAYIARLEAILNKFD